MGMFDWVIVRYPLPIPGDLPEELHPQLRFRQMEQGFQTKNLESGLLIYEIDEAGFLRLVKPPEEGTVRFSGDLKLLMPLTEEPFFLDEDDEDSEVESSPDLGGPICSVFATLEMDEGRVRAVKSYGWRPISQK
jgi:hypothetical protein